MLSSDNSEFDQHNPNAPLYKAYADLFEMFDVDLYLSGHMHVTQRLTSCVVLRRSIAPFRRRVSTDARVVEPDLQKWNRFVVA